MEEAVTEHVKQTDVEFVLGNPQLAVDQIMRLLAAAEKSASRIAALEALLAESAVPNIIVQKSEQYLAERRRCDALREALKPFAEAEPKAYYGDWSNPTRVIHCTKTDLQRARSALTELNP